MAVTLRLPSMFRPTGEAAILVEDPGRTLGDLLERLPDLLPGFRERFDDALFNFAVNDELVLHGLGERPLRDGDVVEIVPTISGGGRPLSA